METTYKLPFVRIPMVGAVNSLNLPLALTLLMYEVYLSKTFCTSRQS
jgi:tRNA G18 (ribose-2'-O)-methylase SpoU